MEQMNELAAFLKEHDRYAVIGHINPDGDAIGCAVAAAILLQKLGKEAFVFLPGGMPVRYNGFECPVCIAACREEMPFEPAAVFTVDVSALDRMGAALDVYNSVNARAVLDHHMTNDGFGDVCVVDGDAAACGELVWQLYRACGKHLSRVSAQWLFIAVCTDSGRFGFSNTRGETLDTAAACVRAGADPDAITNALYRTRRAGHTRLLGEVLHSLQMDESGRLCWSAATDEMFERCGALREDNEGIVNYLVEIEGVEVAVLGETRNGKTKLSLRSRGKVNVAEIAGRLGGGGHSCAAGVSSNLSIEEATATVLKMATEALEDA